MNQAANANPNRGAQYAAAMYRTGSCTWSWTATSPLLHVKRTTQLVTGFVARVHHGPPSDYLIRHLDCVHSGNY